MMPRSGKNGLPTPKRVWVWSSEIAVRTVIEIYRGCALAIDDEQVAMVDHALRHRFVVESKPRGFLVLLGGVASRKDLLEAFDETASDYRKLTHHPSDVSLASLSPGSYTDARPLKGREGSPLFPTFVGLQLKSRKSRYWRPDANKPIVV